MSIADRPPELTRISSNNSTSGTFTDVCSPYLPNLPPDASYDHANFYWRTEVQPQAPVTIYSSNTVGNSTVQMPANQFVGMTARIITGMGAQQERVIASNNASTVTVSPPWTVPPDTSSTFAISQTGYQFGASSTASNTNQVQFSIPNRPGYTIQICGRSANVYDAESPYELSTVTRWQIGGAGISPVDSAVPPAPLFALTALPEGGGVELAGVAVGTLDNMRTVSLGTQTLYYYDESVVGFPPVLASDMTATDSAITLSPMPSLTFPHYLVVGQEVMRLTAETTDQTGFHGRPGGLHTTIATGHAAQTAALPLTQLIAVSYPFLEEYLFGSPACGNWTESIVLANARICSAEFFLTNSQGNSPVTAGAFTTLLGGGLRTLTGGQVVLQVPGFLAVQNGAVPPLDPGATYSVRDVYAYVGTAPAGKTGISLQVLLAGQNYCSLSIAAGATQSATVDGSTLAVLRAGQQLGLNIATVGDQAPGSDLTVVIRV